MNPERWQKIEGLYHAALGHDEAGRIAFLRNACGSDQALLREVESLLRHDDEAEAFMDSPTLEVEGRALAAHATGGIADQRSDFLDRTIAHYRIVEKVGAGGMGEVYRAHDTKLGRDVAIKALPEEFAADPDRLARLEREARVLASLNHPNIEAIHGLEHSGDSSFLVLELIEGESLAERLQRGPIPARQAFELAIQITAGLESAHETGVVHRDLKPSNIQITPDGRVKILDFGLARLDGRSWKLEGHAASGAGETLTIAGTVQGTPHYMSPEQIRGEESDRRTDIWAFGCVLYEMLTGSKAFSRGEVADVLAAVLESEPEWSQLPAGAGPAALGLLRLCLEKDPRNRIQHVNDLRVEVSAILEDQKPISRAMPSGVRWGLAAASSVVIIAVAALLTIMNSGLDRGSLVPIHRQITFDSDVEYPSISPDGQSLAYIKGDQALVRDLDGGPPLVVFEGLVQAPVWSNSGTHLSLNLRRTVEEPAKTLIVSRFGGTSRVLDEPHYRRSWSPDDSRLAGITQNGREIHFTDLWTGARSSIPLSGFSRYLMDLDWSPSGDRLLFHTDDGTNSDTVWTIRVDGTSQKKIVEGAGLSSPRWSADGRFIYYLQAGRESRDLVRIPLSPTSGDASGPPQVLLSGLLVGPRFTLSEDGKLAYTRLVNGANIWSASVSPDGPHNSRPLTSGTGLHRSPSISPDGSQVAFSLQQGRTANILVLPIEGGEARQITFLDAFSTKPVWSPDGQNIAFASDYGGELAVWLVPASGGRPRPLPDAKLSTSFDLSWAPGQLITYQHVGNRDFGLVDPETGDVVGSLNPDSRGFMFSARTSPIGDRVAVYWNRSRPRGLWLVSLTDPTQTTFVSTGDLFPLEWSADGRHVYRWRDGRMEMVGVDNGEITSLFDLPAGSTSPVITPNRRQMVYVISDYQSDAWIMEGIER